MECYRHMNGPGCLECPQCLQAENKRLKDSEAHSAKRLERYHEVGVENKRLRAGLEYVLDIDRRMTDPEHALATICVNTRALLAEKGES